MSLFKGRDPEVIRLLREIQREQDRQGAALEQLKRMTAGIVIITENIYAIIGQRAVRATLHFKSPIGVTIMPASIAVGKTATAVFTEFDAGGVAVAPVGAVTFTSDNPAVATVDPTSGIATGVTAGTANISAVDAGNSLTAADALTVTAALAVTATLVLTANA